VNEGVEWVRSLVPRSHDKLRYGLVKLVLDGSIQGFTARLEWPGYYNGHENGLWYIDPGQLPSIVGAYHEAGLQVHIHTNGDQATAAAIDAIETVLRRAPSADARFTLQHCQMAHDAHFRRMARLGICANLFSNHIHYWGDQHHALTMGPERAERMDAAATAKRLGVAFSIHSDAPVTHLAPLFTAWCAVNRVTESGRVLGAAERLSVADALHAVTLGAAYTLKLDREIGSLETGKRADMTILEDDPLTVDPASLKDVGVWGTVVGGRVFPCDELGAG
jgi:predicted amidohydrolase YtcJ